MGDLSEIRPKGTVVFSYSNHIESDEFFVKGPNSPWGDISFMNHGCLWLGFEMGVMKKSGIKASPK